MAIYRGTGGANEATDLATNQAVIAKEFAEQAGLAASQATLTLDAFQDIYLGPFSTNPTVDNDGNALQVGALYFNTADQLLRVWNGTNWLVSAVSEPSSFTRNTFSGTGSQTVFTLSTTPVNNDSVFVFISGVLTSAYNVSGTTLTFTSAPTSGTNNILAIVASTVSTLAPADNSVSTVKLQNNAVTTAKLADATVTSTQLADNAVTTNKILNANVTLSKLASNSVDASKIVDGSVGTSELATNSVTTSKIASVTSGATVGSASQIPVITYNDKGQITSSSTESLPVLNITNDPTFADSSNNPASTNWVLGRVGPLRHGITAFSAPYTPAPGEALQLAHGLSVVPYSSNFILECVADDRGYVVGDRLTITGQWNGTATSVAFVTQDATNCRLKCGSGFSVFITDKTTGVAFTPTPNAWRYAFVYTY